jgi:hypothetical protein
VETQEREDVVLGADEPIVVNNPKPRKAGNRPEEKTWGTLYLSCSGAYWSKARRSYEGVKVNQRVQTESLNQLEEKITGAETPRERSRRG